MYDGSEINVGTKIEREPFSITQYVVALTDIYADLTQAFNTAEIKQKLIKIT